MSYLLALAATAARRPRTALRGAREYRSDLGMTYDDPARDEAYDAGRELAHVATGRRYDQAAE